MYNLDKLLLMPFHEDFFLDYLISYYGTCIPMGSNQTWRQEKFLLSFSVISAGEL